jgi:hypothetical protein
VQQGGGAVGPRLPVARCGARPRSPQAAAACQRHRARAMPIGHRRGGAAAAWASGSGRGPPPAPHRTAPHQPTQHQPPRTPADDTSDSLVGCTRLCARRWPAAAHLLPLHAPLLVERLGEPGGDMPCRDVPCRQRWGRPHTDDNTLSTRSQLPTDPRWQRHVCGGLWRCVCAGAPAADISPSSMRT